MNEQKTASNGNDKDSLTMTVSNMETSILILFALILVFGAVASKAIMKQYKRSDRR